MNILYNLKLENRIGSLFDEKGWMAGVGIFETIKTVGSKPWALSKHIARSKRSAIVAGIQLPNESDIRAGIEVLLTAEPQVRGALRVLFDASGNWGASHLPYLELTGPAKVAVYPTSVLTKDPVIKRYPYGHRLQILDEMKARGLDEAVVLNADGYICEGAVSNLLLLIDGQWITPELSDGVFPGIMRELVIEELDIKIGSVHVSNINTIDGAILIRSLKIAQEIESIDLRKLSKMSETIVFCDEIRAMALRTSVG